jgi:carbamoyltransferase
MNVLGVNLSHNASVALYEENTISFFFLEERFGKKCPNWAPAFEKNQSDIKYLCLDKIKQQRIDFVAYNIIGANNNILNIIQKQLNNPKYFVTDKKHHVYHALCGAYFSEYDDAISIVIDGAGAVSDFYSNKIDLGKQNFCETESIYYINKKDKKIKLIYANYTDSNKIRVDKKITKCLILEEFKNSDSIIRLSEGVNPGTVFGLLSLKYFENYFNAGKLMGLSSYSCDDNRLKEFKSAIEESKQAQEYLLETTISLIELAKKQNLSNNIILTGGCALNCVNNFKLVKMFPELNFFVDPVPNDAGTAIGCAIYYYDYHK